MFGIRSILQNFQVIYLAFLDYSRVNSDCKASSTDVDKKISEKKARAPAWYLFVLPLDTLGGEFAEGKLADGVATGGES